MKIIEVAEKLRVSRTTVKGWMKKGLIKGKIVKPEKGKGGHEFWVISAEELDNYLKNRN